MEGKGDSDGFRRIEYGHHKETPMDSYGSNEAVWRENETLVDSNGKETSSDRMEMKRRQQWIQIY